MITRSYTQTFCLLQSPVFEIGEDRSAIESLINRLLQPTHNEILSEKKINQPTAVGPVCFSCGGEGHGINRCSRMNTTFPFLPSGWSVNMNNGQYRPTRIGKTTSTVFFGKRGMVRAGGSASRTIGDQSSTDPGGGFRRTKQWITQWQMPAGRNRGRHWAANSQEFPALGTSPNTIRNTEESSCSAGPSTAEMDRLPTASPAPVFRKSGRGMWPAQEIRPTPHKDVIERTRGVTKTIATTSRMPTDSALDRSLSSTGPGKIENPHDKIEIDTAMVGAAYPTKMNKPVANPRCCRNQWPGRNRSRWPGRSRNVIPGSC